MCINNHDNLKMSIKNIKYFFKPLTREQVELRTLEQSQEIRSFNERIQKEKERVENIGIEAARIRFHASAVRRTYLSIYNG